MINRSRSAFEGLHPHEEFVICWDFVLALGPIIKIEPCNSRIRVDLHSLALDKSTAKGLFAIVVKVEDDLVPSLLQL